MDGISICGYLWLAFFIIWMIWAIRTKQTQVRESFGSRFSYVILTVAAFYAMFSDNLPEGWLYLRILPPGPWIKALGIVLTAAGLAFAIWARAYLGKNWSGTVTVKVGHELVRTGPYRWVRHPIYTGMILAMIGTALDRRQLRGVVAVVLLWLGFTIKSRIEERFMAQTFAGEYADYRRTTGALLPRFRQ